MSRATAPTTTTRTIPAAGTVADELDDPTKDPEFARFGKAIILGVVIGIPAMALILALAVKAVAPETSTPGIAAIAAWTALFCGPFLAGTVTVGLYSRHNH